MLNRSKEVAREFTKKRAKSRFHRVLTPQNHSESPHHNLDITEERTICSCGYQVTREELFKTPIEGYVIGIDLPV